MKANRRSNLALVPAMPFPDRAPTCPRQMTSANSRSPVSSADRGLALVKRGLDMSASFYPRILCRTRAGFVPVEADAGSLAAAIPSPATTRRSRLDAGQQRWCEAFSGGRPAARRCPSPRLDAFQVPSHRMRPPAIAVGEHMLEAGRIILAVLASTTSRTRMHAAPRPCGHETHHLQQEIAIRREIVEIAARDASTTHRLPDGVGAIDATICSSPTGIRHPGVRSAQ